MVGGADLCSSSGRSASSSVGRRRTDLHPMTPSLRDTSSSGKPRHRSPGRALSMSRLDQLAKPRQYPTPPAHFMAPLHEKKCSSSQRMSPSNPSPHSRTRSMTHLAGGRAGVGSQSTTTNPTAADSLNKSLSRSTVALVRTTRSEKLRQQARQSAGTNTSPNYDASYSSHL